MSGRYSCDCSWKVFRKAVSVNVKVNGYLRESTAGARKRSKENEIMSKKTDAKINEYDTETVIMTKFQT